MLYSKDQLPDIFKKIDDLIVGSGFKSYKEPAPKYIMGPNWTDELREKNGYTLIDGYRYRHRCGRSYGHRPIQRL